MSKKDVEEKVLKLAYKEINHDDIVRSEKPDFIINSSKSRFGVELTEYFFHDSSARLKYQNKYTSLVADNKWIHKDDTEILESIDTWKINDDDTEEYLGRAVRRKNPTWQEKVHKLNDIIISKNKVFSAYNKRLEYIDLLIYDDCELRRGLDTYELFSFLYQRGVANDLHTPYKNVTLVLLADNNITNTFILKN